jgi:hypothetical protein
MGIPSNNNRQNCSEKHAITKMSLYDAFSLSSPTPAHQVRAQCRVLVHFDFLSFQIAAYP